MFLYSSSASSKYLIEFEHQPTEFVFVFAASERARYGGVFACLLVITQRVAYVAFLAVDLLTWRSLRSISSNAICRNMLKKKKKQGEDELESSTFSLGSQFFEIDDSGNSLEDYKDVDVVSVLPERTHDTLLQGAANNHRSNNHPSLNPRIETQDDGSLDYESGIDKVNASQSNFEFQKSERSSHRKPLAPFSKAPPSKWDDAQKWIASPTSSRPKNDSKKNVHVSHGNRQPITKVHVKLSQIIKLASLQKLMVNSNFLLNHEGGGGSSRSTTINPLRSEGAF
ncbi:hypothetical protein L1887_35390 [Cichorium endivia]|nr:hypothetical protein L1887_35390 [Cichorium endivia]